MKGLRPLEEMYECTSELPLMPCGRTTVGRWPHRRPGVPRKLEPCSIATRRGKRVALTCTHCGITFERPPSLVSKHPFCTVTCRRAHQQKP